MEKKFWNSMAFWGALGLGAAVALEEIGAEWPLALPLAKGLSVLLTAFGFRRAMK